MKKKKDRATTIMLSCIASRFSKGRQCRIKHLMWGHTDKVKEKQDALLTQVSIQLHNLRRAGLCETSGPFQKKYKVQAQQTTSKEPGTRKGRGVRAKLMCTKRLCFVELVISPLTLRYMMP